MKNSPDEKKTTMKKRSKWFYIEASPIIKGEEGDVIKYPVSYKYNGGITIKGKWYDGFFVGQPLVPKGLKLESIAVGLDFNHQPPLATAQLVKK